MKEDVPDPVGVPVICPKEALRESPVGSEPEVIDQVYGVFPPVAERVAEYVVPCCPSGNVEVMI